MGRGACRPCGRRRPEPVMQNRSSPGLKPAGRLPKFSPDSLCGGAGYPAGGPGTSRPPGAGALQGRRVQAGWPSREREARLRQKTGRRKRQRFAAQRIAARRRATGNGALPAPGREGKANRPPECFRRAPRPAAPSRRGRGRRPPAGRGPPTDEIKAVRERSGAGQAAGPLPPERLARRKAGGGREPRSWTRRPPWRCV
jgi:hypothetical protein